MSSELRRAGDEASEIDIWTLGEILWRRRLTVAAVFVLFVILAFVLGLVRPRSYRAVARLSILPSARAIPILANYLGGETAQTAASDAEIIQSRYLIEAALSRLKPEDRAAFPTDWQDVAVAPITSPGSSLISVQVVSTSPRAAAALANAAAEAYVDYVKESNTMMAAAVLESLEPELTAARKRYEEAQAKLAAARRETGVYDFSAEYSSAFGMLEDVRRSAPDSPVRAGIADVEVDLAAERAALAQSQQLLKGASGGGAALLRDRADSSRVAIAEAEAKLTRLRREEGTLQSRLERLNALESRILSFETDVAVKRDIYKTLETKLQQMAVDKVAQLSTVRIAVPAKPPMRPTGSSRRLLLLAGGAVGLILGMALSLMQEGVERRRQRTGPAP